jgi:hypothetical protein
MNTFILMILSLDHHILHPFFNLNIYDKDLVDLAYSGLSPHLKEKLKSHVFSDVSQVLQHALDCESQAKESRSFPRSSDKPRNECHINMLEYSSESSDDEEADMCVAEWNWGPNLNHSYALA